MRVLLMSVVAAAVVLAGCGSGGAAATVGEETVSIEQLQDEVIELSESFDEETPLTADLGDIQQEMLTREILHILLTDLAEQEGVSVSPAEVDAFYDQIEAQTGDMDAIRAQYAFTEDGLRQQLYDELLFAALEAELDNVQAAVIAYGDEVGVVVNPRYGTWGGFGMQPGTGSISVPLS